ncbi:uncharacterized protein [Chironomus tepperi]|uniref:uncharacterized protein n=1 Tax=Chironomus tepperi TaxID=113505 RepID=UPI00391FAAB6
MKTIIHKKDITNDQEAECQQKIQKWLEDIKKVKYCKDVLDVVTQCDNLKIIFDFDCDVTNNAALNDFMDGIITIGAKLSSTRHEQEIKGILARELCRYVMWMTYNNKHDVTSVEEVIANAVKELVEFNEDMEEEAKIEVKFKILFDYFEIFMLPQMIKLPCSMLSHKLELSELKDVKSLTVNNFTIIQTNLPKLLLINIQKCLQIDVNNVVFVTTDMLNSQHKLDNLNIFVINCQKIDENLKNIFAFKSLKLTFIVSDEDEFEELTQKLTQFGLCPTKVKVNYDWNDLTVDSQKILLEMKINFQNNSKFSFLDILNDQYNPGHEEVVRNFSQVIDDQLLALMIENSQIYINSDLNFDEFDQIQFQERKFIKMELELKYNKSQIPIDCQQKSNTIEMSQSELLLDCKMSKFVIISDKPGSGKTWTLNRIAKELHKGYPTKWISYVDLKQFTEQFKDQMAIRSDLEFPQFFIQTVLKHKTNFEVKIFQKMYELGNVLIFMDGLDELSASCTEFILKSINTFESNEGSQLWITACEHLELDLVKVLKHNIQYKFEEVTDEHCADLIATLWMFNDGSCNNFSSYKNLAADLLNKNSNIKFGPIGMPQLCRMIAEVTKTDKIFTKELTELNIFREFIQNVYRKWSGSEQLNFWKFHEFMALKSLFPNYLDFFDDQLEDIKTWTDIGTDLMTKNGIFCDYFIAEFILRTLRHEQQVSNWIQFVPFLLKVLTTRRYQGIRMFLNQDILGLKLNDKIVKSITSNIDEYTNISYIFMENLENLGKFLIIILNRRRYKIVKNILITNIDAIFASIKKSKFPINPQIFLDFLVKFLNGKCLENLIKKEKLFFKVIESCEDIDHFGRFANDVKLKLGSNAVVQNFKTHRRAEKPNIFFTFCWSKNLDSQKIQKFIKILKSFLNIRKIMELLNVKTRQGTNIIIDCIMRDDPRILTTFWTEIENFYKSNESHSKFKELITFRSPYNWPILTTIAQSGNIELYDTFWDLMTATFNHMELKDFLLQTDKFTSFMDAFLIQQISNSENSKIIEFTFEKLQKIFNNDEFLEIMSVKSNVGGNFLLNAVNYAKNVEIFESIWNLVRNNLCKSDDEFLKFINDVDDCGNNILAAALGLTDCKIFDFIIHNLKCLTTRENLKSMLMNLNDQNQNILFKIYNPESFLSAWTVINDYLNPSEIFEILQNCEKNSNNNFILNISYYTSYAHDNICKKIWIKVKEFIIKHAVMSAEAIDSIEKCDKFIDNFNELRYKKDSIEEYMRLKWLKIKDLEILDSPETLRHEITGSGLFSSAYDFYILAKCENLEIHEICWDFIIKKYENLDNLVKLMTVRSVHGSIFIHSIMSNKNINVIKFILKIIQDKFNKAQIREILTVQDDHLLSIAVRALKDVEIVKILWTLHQNCFSSTENVEIMSQNIETKSNLILNAAQSSTDIFNFIWTEVNKLLDLEGTEKDQKLTELIMQRNEYRQNILHVCVKQHDINLLKLVCNAVKDILGGSVKPIMKLFVLDDRNNYDWFNDILSLFEYAVDCTDIEFHEALWQLMNEDFTKAELKELILWKNDGKVTEIVKNDDESSSSDEEYSESDDYSQYSEYVKDVAADDVPYDYNEQNNMSNILYILTKIFQSSNLHAIKFTIHNLNEILTKNEICKILTYNQHDCFLINPSKSIEYHEYMWDVYRQYLTLSDIKDPQRFFSQVIYNAVRISIEIFNFTWNQVIQEAENVVIPAIENNSHIICACISQKDTEFLKFLWTKVQKFYEIQNLPESFKEFTTMRIWSENIIQASSQINDVLFHETMWNLLLSTFENREELKNILIRKSEYNGCLIDDLFKIVDINVVKYLIKMLDENFTVSQLQELLSADANMLYNCLINGHKQTQIFEIWWTFFKKIFQNFDNFMDINDNLVTICRYGSDKILEIVFMDINLLMTRDEIRKNLLKINENYENILHVGLNRCNSYGYDVTCSWQYIHKYLNKNEILNLLTQIDSHKRTFLFYVIMNSSVDVVDKIWNEIKKVSSHDDQIGLLKSRHPKYGNLYQCAATYLYLNEGKLSWIEMTLRKYKIRINK